MLTECCTSERVTRAYANGPVVTTGGSLSSIITLEGAMELLLTMKSDFKGCMVKMMVKDAVDVMAGTAEMLDRVQVSNQDPTREPLRQSCKNRDASGEGQAALGGGGGEDVEMQDSSSELKDVKWLVRHSPQYLAVKKAEYEMQVDAQNKIKAMEVDAEKQMHEIKQKDRDHELETERKRRAMLADETMHARRMELRRLIDQETNVAAKNILYEEYLHLCKMCAFGFLGTAPLPAPTAGEYKTVEEALRMRSDCSSVMRYAKELGRMLAGEYRKNYSRGPEFCQAPDGRRHNHYLPKDLEKIDQFLKEIRLKLASQIANNQPSILGHFS